MAGTVVHGVPAQTHIADIKANFATPELDTEAEVITAINNIGLKINALLAALETAGVLKVS
jgi:hypothetical protein